MKDTNNDQKPDRPDVPDDGGSVESDQEDISKSIKILVKLLITVEKEYSEHETKKIKLT